jgi:4-hydroxybenzoate polyprenyltransferase
MYVVNDLVDLSADRKHPKKRLRPFAAGMLPIGQGVILSLLLMVAAFVLAVIYLPLLFAATLILYIGVTVAYSFYFKRVPVADVVILAGLYTLRVIAGGAATALTISPWLLAFSMFLFLSLAFAKRYAELNVLQLAAEKTTPGRGYVFGDKDWMSNMGCASGYLSVLVLALYINSQDVLAVYRHPRILWLACPLLLYWISRLWLLAYRGRLDEDPILVTARDPVSYSIAVGVAVILIAATF